MPSLSIMACAVIYMSCIFAVTSITPIPPARPVDFPDELAYDSHNRLAEYEVTEDRKIRLYYDPAGRVFRKEVYDWDDPSWDLSDATHYYYKGGRLIQEFDEMVVDTVLTDDIEWDYLRGLGGQVVRKRETDGETDTDTLHVNSAIGTTLNVLFPDMDTPTLKEGGYKTTAEGEPFHVTGFEPQEENHIQYHGGFLEDKEFHTSVAGQERGYFYRMGVRHYVPAFGRFMQRDPITYMRAPHKTNPLSANPYQYAYNRPTQMSDISGYQPEGPETLPAEWSGFGGGSGTDGGCGHSPFRNTPGSGSDDNGDDSEEKGIGCTKYYPRECLEEGEDPETCTEFCCTTEADPSWMSGCCLKSHQIILNPCSYTDEGYCACGCCQGGEENAPNAMGGGAFGGGGSITFGPPRYGFGGDGGYPWEVWPRPHGPIFPWRDPSVGPNPWNSISGNQSAGSNIHGSMTPMFAWIPIAAAGLALGALAIHHLCNSGGRGSSGDPYCPAKPKEECSVWENCLCVFCHTISGWGTLGVWAGAGMAVGALFLTGGLSIIVLLTGGLLFVGSIWRAINDFYDCLEKYGSTPRDKWKDLRKRS